MRVGDRVRRGVGEKGLRRIPRMQLAESQLHFSPRRNSPSRDELPAIELATGAYRRNGESQNWLPGYRGCRWKVDDGYGGTISSFNARSLLIRRYYFGTSPRSSPRRKKKLRERVNAAARYLCGVETRSDTRGLAAFPKLSELGRETKEKKKKRKAKARPRSGITARQFPEGLGFTYVKQCREGKLVIFQIRPLS